MFAAGEFAVPSLRAVAGGPHELVALVTQPARPSGRGREIRVTPAAEWAARLGVPVIECADVNDAAFVQRVRGFDARLGIAIAFGQKLGRAVRAATTCGCVNLHGSLLPKYRGAAPIAWAILAGETRTGVTVFRLVDRMDAGDILVQRETMIGEAETAGELHDRLAQIGPDAIKATLPLFEQDDAPPGRPQDERRVSLAPKLNKDAGRLDFRRAAEPLARHVRAMTPWPGARCVFVRADGGERVDVSLLCARALPSRATGRGAKAVHGRSASGEPTDPGGADVGRIDERHLVVTGFGSLQIIEIKPAGGRAMGWTDFVNGRHVQPGDRFESVAAE